MDLSEETMQVAKSTLKDGHLHSTVNRLYYACFYLVTALLFVEGHTSSKHSGIRSLFNQHWIKTGRLPVEMSSLYRSLFNHRQKGDYEDFVIFHQDEVKEWLKEAELFVDKITRKIEAELEELKRR